MHESSRLARGVGQQVLLPLVALCATFVIYRQLGVYDDQFLAYCPAGILLALLVIRSERFLIFSTALIFMLCQTTAFADNAILKWGRWFMLGIYAIPVAVRLLTQRPPRRFRLLDLVAVLFLTYALLSATYSQAPDLTTQRAISLILLYIAAFWAIWDYADRRDEEQVIAPILAAATLIYAIGLMLIPFTATAWQDDGRFRGILQNPNAVGLLTAILLPLVIWRVSQYRRWFDLCLLAAMGMSVALSGSRAGVYVGLIAIVYMIGKSWTGKLLLILSVLGVALTLEYASLEYVDSRTPLGRLVRTDKFARGSGRTEAWGLAWTLIQRQPWLGYGFGTEDLAIEASGERLREAQGNYFHNAYLGMAYQLGAVGCVLYFLPLFALLAWSAHRSRGPSSPLLVRALQAVVLCGLTAALFESWIYSVGNAFSFPFWVCVMLLVRSHDPKRVTDPVGSPGRPQPDVSCAFSR